MALLLGLAVLTPADRAPAQGFVIVVNEAGPVSLTTHDVSRIFLKKVTRLTPVDQEKHAKVRATSSKAVLGRPISAIVRYWRQQMFSGGDSPPVEKASDADVLEYVRANPKGIGYVSAGTDLGTGVRAIALP